MILVKWLSIADRYTKMYLDRLLSPLGINSSQHMYITIICRNPGITQEQFTKMTYLNPSNITRALNFLIKSGFLKRVISSTDKRRNCLYPTAKAYAANKVILDAMDEIENTLLENIPAQERQLFLKTLNQTALKAVSLNSKEGGSFYGTDRNTAESSGV